ncbi:MAG: DUF1761 domain-containing protein [Chitinophagales bacterium]|nr:DUF1761 domain-containing protein [Chitinophagales bacterium]MDW8428525.1 DUF1761 domain-containing protein [Chitinophagales bacterium]
MKNAILYLNWPMVVATAGIYLALGYLWYRLLFGRFWVQTLQLKTGHFKWGLIPVSGPEHNGESKGNGTFGGILQLVFQFGLLFVICTVVGLMLNAIRCKEMSDCFVRSYILIAGMVGGLVGSTLNVQRRPLSIWIIDISYHLVGTVIATLLLAKYGMTGSAY